MRLSEILEHLSFTVTAGNSEERLLPGDTEIRALVNDTRRISDG